MFVVSGTSVNLWMGIDATSVGPILDSVYVDDVGNFYVDDTSNFYVEGE